MIAFGMPSLGELIVLLGCAAVPLAAAGVTAAIIYLTRKPQQPPPGAFPVQPLPTVITRFRVQATERTTGVPSTFELRASTVDQARDAAAKAGYDVRSVEPVVD